MTAGNIEKVERPTAMHTLLAVVVAILVAVFVWVFGGVAFTALDYLRGNADSVLQRVARDIMVPGASGYLAMAAAGRWVRRCQPVVVFGTFAALAGLLLGAYLILWWLTAAEVSLASWEMALGAGSFIALIVGSFYGYQSLQE